MISCQNAILQSFHMLILPVILTQSEEFVVQNMARKENFHLKEVNKSQFTQQTSKTIN